MTVACRSRTLLLWTLFVVFAPPLGAAAQLPTLPAAAGSETEPAADPAEEADPQAGGGEDTGEQTAAPELIELEGPLLEASTWTRLGDVLLERAIDFLPSLAKALIVLLAFYFFYRLSAGVLGGVFRRTGAEPALQGIVKSLLRYALLGLAAIMALSQLGFNIASMLAGLGIVGLAVGLAAQETVANLIAGLTILWDRPFRIGDNVTIAGTFGTVREIGLRTTRIETVDRLDAILPNKEVINQKILNHTLNPEFRLPVPLGIAYKEDSREARKVLLDAVVGHRLILEEPAPVVVVTGLGDSSVNLELRVWLRDPYTEREALFELTEIAKIALDEAGIEIPFPQRTLHFGSGTFPLSVAGPSAVTPPGEGAPGGGGEEG